MEGAKQKVKDMASAAKQHAQIYEAKVEEKMEKAGARTEEQRELATERRKVKEAEAKADLHASKAGHVEEKVESKQHPIHIPGIGGAHHQYPPGGAASAQDYNYGGGYQETTPHHHIPGQHEGVDPLHPHHHVPGTGAAYPSETTRHHLPGRRLP